MRPQASSSLVQEGFIRANGITFHYAEQGAGPLVLLLHGFPEFWYSWRYQLPALAEAGYRAVAPDLRGYHLSEKPTSGYDLETLASDIVGLIQAFGGKKAHIVGHDWGGAIAWYVATFWPSLVDKLVVMNCPHPNLFYKGILKPAQLKRSWYMFFFQIPWLPEWLLSRNDYQFIKATLRGSAVQKQSFDRETLHRYRDAIAVPYALTHALAYYRMLFKDLIARRHIPWQTPVEVPTLLIWGEQDMALGKELNEGLSEWVKDLTIHYIPDSGHWVQQERPLEVNRLMLAFLGSARCEHEKKQPSPQRARRRSVARTSKKQR